MSNHLGQIYSTTKNAEKYIVLNSQNVELSGNVKLTNGNLDVSQNLIFNNFSVTDKINFRENSGSTSYNIINNSLTANNDASFNNVEINGTIKLPDSSNNGYGNTGELLTSRGANNTPHWVTPIKRLFQSYNFGTQTGPNGVIINTWNTSNPRHIDTENALNSSYGLVSNQYIISTAGYWRFACHVVFSNSPGNSASLNCYLRINNSLTNPVINKCQLTDATFNPDQQGVSVSAILNLSVGDSIDVYVSQYTAMPLANVTDAMFEGEYLGV